MLCCGFTTSLPSTPQGPWRRCSPPPPGPQPLKLTFWHIVPVAQLDTHLLHFSGYNSWVVKLFFFSSPSARKVKEHLQGMQPLCTFTRRVPRTPENQVPRRTNEQVSLGHPMMFSNAW